MENIRVQMVIEILGRPAEHVASALSQLIDKLGSEKGVKVIEKKIHEPHPVENSDLFTAFADVSIELESLSVYFGIIFAYMPSHIEIVSPEDLMIKNHNLTDVGNSLLSRLHQYDSIAKKLIMDREALVKKLKEVSPELFTQQEMKEEKAEKPKNPVKKKSKKK